MKKRRPTILEKTKWGELELRRHARLNTRAMHQYMMDLNLKHPSKQELEEVSIKKVIAGSTPLDLNDTQQTTKFQSKNPQRRLKVSALENIFCFVCLFACLFLFCFVFIIILVAPARIAGGNKY